MLLTDAQIAVFSADIYANTDPYVVEQLAAGGHGGVLNWYNGLATPAYYVWKTNISTTDIFNAVVWSGTGGFISRSAGERDGFIALTARGNVDPSRANIRQALADIFSGVGQAAVDTRAAITAVSKRQATNIEKLFAVGSGTLASPSDLVVQGQLVVEDVVRAIQLGE